MRSLIRLSLTKYFGKRYFAIISLAAVLCFLGLYAAGYYQEVQADNPTGSAEPTESTAQTKGPHYDYGASPQGVYQELDVRNGIHNDGQAALWDLHILEHFRLFGPSERMRGYSPDQPIRFSHITHVQANKMECTYCHYSVDKAAFAAIPPVETCWGCHQIIKGQTEQQQTEIKKLEEFVSKGEPIPWQKVHVFPDHAHFNHKRHVKAGVTCQECHGQIPNMQKVERASSMKMGWCLDCHRQRATSIDCYTCHY